MIHAARLLLLLSVSASTALAQDSLPLTGPSDAPAAYDSNDQVDFYVVDLDPFTTSWGTRFGIGILAKSTDSDGTGGFRNDLISAQAISQDMVTRNVFETYALWEQVAGPGVSNTNVSPDSIDVDQDMLQQAFTFATFNFGTNSVQGGLIHLCPIDATRLYVRRVIGGTNKEGSGRGPGAASLSDLGVGAIDADGNGYLRVGETTPGGPLNLFVPVSDENWARIRFEDRLPGVVNPLGINANTMVFSGDPGSSEFVHTDPMQGSVLVVPQALPESIFGGPSGLIAGPNFMDEYLYGRTPADVAASATMSHLTGLPLRAPRGAFGYTPGTFAGFASPGSSTLGMVQGLSGQRVETAVWSVDGTAGNEGDVLSTLRLTPANPLLDNALSPPTTVSIDWVADQYSNVHTLSQVPFRGGSGQVALHVLPSGDLVVAQTISRGGFANSPEQAIYSIHRDAQSGLERSTLVAYVNAAQKKEILDGPGGSTIGRLTELFNLTGGAPLGPSTTTPAFDSHGNLWFVSSIELDLPNSQTRNSVGLIRAVYDETNHAYQLELILEAGDVFAGVNSGVPYQISFIVIADSGSISSGSLTSSNVSKETALQLPGPFQNADPETNGGVILNAEIIYDVNGDGIFDNPRSVTTPDQDYQVVLYIGATNTIDLCLGDANGDGTVSGIDIGGFVNAFNTMLGDANYNPVFDFNGDDRVDGIDAGGFVNVFNTDCPSCPDDS